MVSISTGAESTVAEPPGDDARPEAALTGAPSENGTAPDVLAAGVLCWRTGADGVEVLMVHRPKYDDWSFPKGKIEEGELLPECAIRELAEETGVEALLGRPLPVVRYRDQEGACKEVTYWTGRPVRQGHRTASPNEVDATAWLRLADARERLSQASDAVPLQALELMAAEGELATTPLVVVRHGTARPRDAWARADAERPLIASGRRQAAALTTLLACWRPEQVLSSPWRRCVDSISPYASAAQLKIRAKGGLSERGFRRDPDKARKHLLALVDRGRPAALCTHRPVLAGIFRAMRERTARDLVEHIPAEDPYLAPGEVLVAHVVHPPSRPAYVVGLERHLAPR